MANTNRELFQSIIDDIELEVRDNHPNIYTDRDKYAIGVNNGLQLAKAIIYKHRNNFVLCSECGYFRPGYCIRKIKAGGPRAIDKVRPNDWCAYGRRKNNDISE